MPLGKGTLVSEVGALLDARLPMAVSLLQCYRHSPGMTCRSHPFGRGWYIFLKSASS